MKNSHRHWVFAYGSNMHASDLRRWLRERGHNPEGIAETAPARLEDHRLVWNYYSEVRLGAAANVEPAPGVSLLGAALRVSDPMLEAIDLKEGHPHRYHRGSKPRACRLLSGQFIEAWLYVVRPQFLRDSFVAPRAHYVKLMVEGAHELGLDRSYIDRLMQVPTQESLGAP